MFLIIEIIVCKYFDYLTGDQTEISSQCPFVSLIEPLIEPLMKDGAMR